MSNVTEMHRVIDLPTSLHISVCVTAVLVNSFVLVVIWKDPKKCLRTRSAMLITSLIISDLFAAVVNITRTVHEIWLESRLQSRPIAFVLIIGSYDALMISFVTFTGYNTSYQVENPCHEETDISNYYFNLARFYHHPRWCIPSTWIQ